MKHLICTYGAGQSGKTTSATVLYGYYLTSLGIIPNCNIDPNGRMSIIYNKSNNNGIYFDIDDNSQEMIDFKSKNVWAYIKHVSFADALKESIVKLFGIKRELIYGSNDDKNTKTHIKWANVWSFLSTKRQNQIQSKWVDPLQALTVRELCQVFGTDICRSMDIDCHLRSALNLLKSEDPDIGICPDGRFDNEFFFFNTDEAKELLGDTKIWRVKYTRNAHPNNVPGEQGLPEVDENLFDLVIDNRDLTVLQKNEIFINFFINKGVLPHTGVFTSK